MFSLFLGILGSSMLSIFMRLSERKITNNIAMLAMNYLTCSLLGLAYAVISGPVAIGPRLHLTAGMGVLNGIFFLSSFVLFQTSVRRNGVVLSSTFMKLGLLVTMVISICVYREMPDGLQILGFLLALCAIVLINYRREENASGFRWGLIALLLLSGMGDAMAKIFEESGLNGMADWFLLFTFATALPFALLLMAVKGQRIGKWEILFGAAIGIPNFFSSKLLLQALETIPAVVVYPVYNVGVILVVTVTGVLLFRERLSRRQMVGLGLILGALVLLNI